MKTGQCLIEPRDCLRYPSPMAAGIAKGMPTAGLFVPKLVPGLSYTTEPTPDGAILVRWKPTKKPGTASP